MPDVSRKHIFSLTINIASITLRSDYIAFTEPKNVLLNFFIYSVGLILQVRDLIRKEYERNGEERERLKKRQNGCGSTIMRGRGGCEGV